MVICSLTPVITYCEPVIAPIPWCEYGSDAEILRLESAWFHTDDDTHIRE